MKRKKPYFGWGLPKDYWKFFDPSFDDAFKRKHPVLYVLVILAIVVLACAPFGAYCCIAHAIEPAIDTTSELIFFLLGMLGSFLAGFGLCNLFLLLHDEYLGHWVTLITMGGGLIVASACLLLLAA